MSSRSRVVVIVALVAAASATLVTGVTLATRQTPDQPRARKSDPPLVIDSPTPAAASIRAAYARWPDGTLAEMERLGRRRPDDPVVQFQLGIARLWAGYPREAVGAFRKAKQVGRDTPYEIRSDNILHPQFFPQGYPIFQPTRPDALLLEGIRLQRAGKQHSAERVYARAARARPRDDEAQVAAAVGRFDMDHLERSFGRLGPLTRRFPHSQSVRFHLGLLLAWTGQRDAAVGQFRRARSLGPETGLGREANRFLDRLVGAGTNTPKR